MIKQYQPFPHMPSTKDGKPFYDAAGKPVILHSEEEENAFRAEHPDAADRVEPVKPPAQDLEEAHAEIEALRAENAVLKSDNDALRAEVEAAKIAHVDTDHSDDNAPKGKGKGK